MALIFGAYAGIGALLGLRFKVTVLVPSIGMDTSSNAAVKASFGANSLAIVSMAVVSLIALQLGYLIGLAAYGCQFNITLCWRQITNLTAGSIQCFSQLKRRGYPPLIVCAAAVCGVFDTLYY